jgi:hypothetical protein
MKKEFGQSYGKPSNSPMSWHCDRNSYGPRSPSKDGLRLGQLISELEKSQAKTVRIAGPIPMHPQRVYSYRGYYSDLAIEFNSSTPITLETFVATLRSADGHIFEGYKGGEFTMDLNTLMWISEYGIASNTQISGVHVDTDFAENKIANLVPLMKWNKDE